MNERDAKVQAQGRETATLQTRMARRYKPKEEPTGGHYVPAKGFVAGDTAAYVKWT